LLSNNELLSLGLRCVGQKISPTLNFSSVMKPRHLDVNKQIMLENIVSSSNGYLDKHLIGGFCLQTYSTKP
jgi:hypothetical protein